MKKVLLAGTALIGLAFASAPAHAELNLDLGGYFRGYGVYNDSDDAFAAGADYRDFDLKRDTEIHFNGEATTDNGLTIGAHYELGIGGAVATDEAYLYTSGQWGRFNLGSEDGAAYLLQVAAPSADSNVDGLRTQIQNVAAAGLAADASFAGTTSMFTNGTTSGTAALQQVLDYDHADFQDSERLTYLTPKWNGFQGGVSYAPEAGQNALGDNLNGPSLTAGANTFEDLWEAAVRWDGEFQGFGVSFGGGYSTADNINDGAALGDITDGLDTWNVGLNVAFQGFSVGASYLDSSSEESDGAAGTADVDGDVWVVGAAWDNGPYHLGASYLNGNQTNDAVGSDIDADRWTVGAGYTYGPGMSFRGAVAFGNVDTGAVGGDDDFTQVTVGTDIQF